MKILTPEDFKVFDSNGFDRQDDGASGIVLVRESTQTELRCVRNGRSRSGAEAPRPSHLRRIHRARRRWAACGFRLA